METEYEKLKKEGYTEEEIDAKLGPMSRLSIDSSPMGQGRDDRSVTFMDKDGTVSRSSNIMMGYNRRNIQLPNGTYVGVEEFSRAMTEYLQENAGNKVIFCRRTGKRVNVDELIDGLREVAQSQAGLEVHGTTDKMHGNAYEYSIKGDTARRVLLGKKVQLECGQWVSEEELLNAMRDYVYLSAPVPDKNGNEPYYDPGEKGNEPYPGLGGNGNEPYYDPGEKGNEPYPGLGGNGNEPYFGPGENVPGPDNIIGVDERGIEGVATKGGGRHLKDPDSGKHGKHEKVPDKSKHGKHEVKDRKRGKKILPLIILLAGMIATLVVPMIGKKNVDVMGEDITTTREASAIVTQVDDYQRGQDGEAAKEITKQIIGSASVGDPIKMPAGVIYFYASPDNEISKSRTGVIGETPERPAGEYEIFGASVLDKSGQKILDTEFEKGTPLAEVVQRVCENQNVDLEETDLRISLTNTGWIKLNDLVEKVLEEKEITPDDIVASYHSEQTYDAVQEDFTDSVTFKTDDGEVTIKVRNDDGSLVEPGTVLEGSDGKLYRLDDVGVEQKDTVTPYVERTEEKRTLSISNIPENIKEAGILAAATVAATAAATVIVNQREKGFGIAKDDYEKNTVYLSTLDDVAGLDNTPDYGGPSR